jgi:hypothetical protein
MFKVLKGSHKCGRIDHTMVAGQTAADIDRVEELKKKLELVHVELDPGKVNSSSICWNLRCIMSSAIWPMYVQGQMLPD